MSEVVMSYEDYHKMLKEIDDGIDEFVENIQKKYGVKINLGDLRWVIETDIEFE